MKLYFAIVLVFISRSDGFSFFRKPALEQCGLNSGGVIIQQVTPPATDQSTGLYWSQGTLLYLDAYKPAVCTYKPQTNVGGCATLSGVDSILEIFVTKNSKGITQLLGGADTSLLLINAEYDQQGVIINVTSTKIGSVSENYTDVLRHGKIDKMGRLWTYSGSFDGTTTKIYKIEKENVHIMEETDSKISSIAINYENTKLYTTDINNRFVYSYDLNVQEGTISNQQVVFNQSNYDFLLGNVCAVDVSKDGNLWLGICKMGQILQFDPSTSKIKQAFGIPASSPIGSIGFGGDNFETIYVGSLKSFVDDPRLEPGAGAVFAISGTGSRGFENNRYVTK